MVATAARSGVPNGRVMAQKESRFGVVNGGTVPPTGDSDLSTVTTPLNGGPGRGQVPGRLAHGEERSPDERYRTAPLKWLWAHTKGGFDHDGRFATLQDVINHYSAHFHLGLTQVEINDLAE